MTATIEDTTVTSEFSWTLEAVDPPFISNSYFIDALLLPDIELTMKDTDRIDLISSDFEKSYQLKSYQYIADNRGKAFSEFDGEKKLTLSPGKYSGGLYNYYFYAITTTKKYLQRVKVYVQSTTTVNPNILTAQIHSIGRTGEV